MTLRALLLAAVLVLPPATGFAQRETPPTKFAASSQEVQALIAKLRAMTPVKPLVSANILGQQPYEINMEYRAIPGANPAIHPKQYELLYVLEGSGSFTMGGKVDGQKIDGGDVSHISKGDFRFIPAGTPHLSTPDQGVALVLMVMHGPGDAPEQ